MKSSLKNQKNYDTPKALLGRKFILMLLFVLPVCIMFAVLPVDIHAITGPGLTTDIEGYWIIIPNGSIIRIACTTTEIQKEKPVKDCVGYLYVDKLPDFDKGDWIFKVSGYVDVNKKVRTYEGCERGNRHTADCTLKPVKITLYSPGKILYESPDGRKLKFYRKAGNFPKDTVEEYPLPPVEQRQ
jgi:hypothetical protein